MSEPDCWMFLSWLAHNFSRVCVASIASIYGHGPSIQQCCEPVWCRCSLASRHGARPSQDRVVFYGRAREWCLGTNTWRGCRARAPASRPLNPSHLCWLQRAVHRSYGDLTVGDLYQSGTQLTARIAGVRKKIICHQSPNLSFCWQVFATIRRSTTSFKILIWFVLLWSSSEIELKLMMTSRTISAVFYPDLIMNLDWCEDLSTRWITERFKNMFNDV